MRYGEDLTKASYAGLLHDCAKHMSGEKLLEKCRSHHLPVSDMEAKNPFLLHGRVGAWLAGHRYGVEDPEILAIYDMLLAETSKRGIAAGLHNGSPAYANKMIQKGFKLVTIANEVGLMCQAATAAVKTARG